MRLKINYNIVILFLFSIFPFLLITGPFLSDLFCIVIGLFYVYYNFEKKNWKAFFDIYKNYIYFFVSFYIYLNINSFFSFDPKISFLSTIPFFRIILYIFALALFFSKFKNLYKIFLISFFFAVTILLMDSLLQFILERNILGNKVGINNRISSFFGDELIMGSYVTRLLPICLACSIIANLRHKYFINILLIFISGILVALSGERLACFYYVCTISIYLMITKKYLLTFFLAIIISLYSLNLYKPTIIERFVINTIDQLNQTNSVFSYRHTLHYKTAFEMFLDKKLLGHGIKSFRHLCSKEKYKNLIQLKKNNDKKKFAKEKSQDVGYIDEYENGCNTHPHNIFLEYLSELGITGVLFLIMIYVYTFFNFARLFIKSFLIKSINHLSVAKSIVLSGILLQLFPLLPSGSYFNNYMMIVFYLSIGFYLSLLKYKE